MMQLHKRTEHKQKKNMQEINITLSAIVCLCICRISFGVTMSLTWESSSECAAGPRAHIFPGSKPRRQLLFLISSWGFYFNILPFTSLLLECHLGLFLAAH